MVEIKSKQEASHEDLYEFSDFVEGYKDIDVNFLKFIFSLYKSYEIEDEKFQNARKKAVTFIDLKNKKHEDFLDTFGEYFSLSSEEIKNLKELNKQKEYSKIIIFLLNKKFDFEFDNELLLESIKLNNAPDLDFLKSSFKSICAVEKNHSILKYFVYSVESTNKTTNFIGLIPIMGNTYAYHLVLYDKVNKTLEIRGAKRGYKKITNFLNKQGFNFQIDYEIHESELKEDFLLNFIKSINFKIYGIEYFDSKEIIINAESSKYDLDFLINNLLLLTDKVDLFNFKSLKFIYHDSNLKDILGEIRLSLYYKQGYYKIETIVKSNSEEKEIIDDKIKKLFNIEIGKKYSLYNSYYLKKIFSSNNRAYWYNIVKQKQDFSGTFSLLTEEKIITGSKTRIILNKKKLAWLLKKIIDELKNFRLPDFAIDKVEIENDFVILYGFYTENSSHYKKLFRLKISFGNNQNNFLHFNSLDWYKIITDYKNLEKCREELLLYFYKKVKFFDILSKNMLDKRSLESYNFLVNRMNTINETKEVSIRGKNIENETNCLIEGLFRNYISLGIGESPDGLLYLNDFLFIVDCKSKEKIDSGDIDELIRYLGLNYFENSLVKHTKKGIFVYDNLLIKSLNGETLLERTQKEKFEVSYISLDLLLKLYSFIKEHFDEIYLKPSFMEEVYLDFCKLIEETSISKLNSQQDILKSIKSLEDDFISKIKSKIQKHTLICDIIRDKNEREN